MTYDMISNTINKNIITTKNSTSTANNNKTEGYVTDSRDTTKPQKYKILCLSVCLSSSLSSYFSLSHKRNR